MRNLFLTLILLFILINVNAQSAPVGVFKSVSIKEKSIGLMLINSTDTDVDSAFSYWSNGVTDTMIYFDYVGKQNIRLISIPVKGNNWKLDSCNVYQNGQLINTKEMDSDGNIK